MIQMHAYYISNATNEIKYAYKELNDDEFENIITKTIFPFDDEDSDNEDPDDDIELENNQFEENENEDSRNFDLFFNVTDTELRQILEIEVTVEVPFSSEQINDDDGVQDFNIESIVNRALERRISNTNEIAE